MPSNYEIHKWINPFTGSEPSDSVTSHVWMHKLGTKDSTHEPYVHVSHSTIIFPHPWCTKKFFSYFTCCEYWWINMGSQIPLCDANLISVSFIPQRGNFLVFFIMFVLVYSFPTNSVWKFILSPSSSTFDIF
jgi:hypothetical protein